MIEPLGNRLPKWQLALAWFSERRLENGAPSDEAIRVMHIQIINFNLKDVSREDYEGSCSEIAQAFADLPGLQSKHWLADEVGNTYGGVYIWESREAMQQYLESELFSQVANNPAFENVSSREFEVLEGPTRVTRGMD